MCTSDPTLAIQTPKWGTFLLFPSKRFRINELQNWEYKPVEKSFALVKTQLKPWSQQGLRQTGTGPTGLSLCPAGLEPVGTCVCPWPRWEVVPQLTSLLAGNLLLIYLLSVCKQLGLCCPSFPCGIHFADIFSKSNHISSQPSFVELNELNC